MTVFLQNRANAVKTAQRAASSQGRARGAPDTEQPTREASWANAASRLIKVKPVVGSGLGVPARRPSGAGGPMRGQDSESDFVGNRIVTLNQPRAAPSRPARIAGTPVTIGTRMSSTLMPPYVA